MPTMPDRAETEAPERPQPRERIETALAEITALLRRLRLVEGLLKEQHAGSSGIDPSGRAESVVTRQNREELVRKLDRLHAADIAYVLEALPLDERLYIWNLVRASRDGDRNKFFASCCVMVEPPATTRPFFWFFSSAVWMPSQSKPS